MLRFVIICNL